MTENEKELIFERAKTALKRIEDENTSWNPFNKEQQCAWAWGRRHEAMQIIKALDLTLDYMIWESEQEND